MSRLQIENIVTRSMEIRRLNVSPGDTKAALLDVILDHAISLRDKTAGLVAQSHGGSKDRARLVRKACAEWRAIIKGVKAVIGDHKISERHLAVVLVGSPLRELLPTGMPHHLTGFEVLALGNCTNTPASRAMLRKLLSVSY